MIDVPNLRVEDEGAVRVITIDRPEVKNALSQSMRDHFIDIVAESDADPDVRVLVITATDPVFSAGVDFKDRPPALDPVRRVLRTDPAAALRIARTPSICAVNGACVSGALEIALSSTFVIASERARFADTHARLDVVPAWGLTALLPRAVGLRMAREMSITCRFVDAEEALRIGLVNHVVPHEDLRSRALALAQEIVPTLAALEVLRLYSRSDGSGLEDAVALEREWNVNRVATVAAFGAPGGAETANRDEGRQ